MKKNKTGTKEWSDVSFNCVKGCGNDCSYCYAKRMNKRFTRKGVKPHKWDKEIKIDRLKQASKKYKGTVMFPTAHDITLNNYEHCIKHLKALLAAGNKVLVVSKMSPYVATAIIENIQPAKNLEIRITITNNDKEINRYFEKYAPVFEERLLSLEFLNNAGFFTSVSIEPFLTCPELIIEEVMPHCRGQIWIGGVTGYKLNNKNGIEAFLACMYSKVRLNVIYEKYKNNPKVSFKESFMRRFK